MPEQRHFDNCYYIDTDFIFLSLLDEASEAAIKAANAYSQIVTSINQAYNASQDALDNAKKAIQEVSTELLHNNYDGNRKFLYESKIIHGVGPWSTLSCYLKFYWCVKLPHKNWCWPALCSKALYYCIFLYTDVL